MGVRLQQRKGTMGNRMRGFTLIELLVVIVVGGLLAQLAIKGIGEASGRISARESRNVAINDKTPIPTMIRIIVAMIQHLP